MKKHNGIATLGALVSAMALALTMTACGTQEQQGTSEAESGSAAAQSVASYAVSEAAVATATSMPTADKHAAFDVSCADCHGTEAPTSAPTSDESCRSCHDSTELAQATASLEDIPNREVNPHNSHMYGASCTSCHSNHGDSQVACNECHVNEYHWDVP